MKLITTFLFLCTGNSAGATGYSTLGHRDPAAVTGTEEQVQRAFRDAFFRLDRRISLFLSLPLATLDGLALKKEMTRIGGL